MKILMITRLMSGFISSVESGHWRPSGAPAIYRMIDRLDASEHALDVRFTLKSFENISNEFLEKPLSLHGLQSSCFVYSGPEHFKKIWGPLRTYLSEFKQAWRVFRYVCKTKPDLVYIDRSNILLAAFIARWTSVPVHLRLLGVPPYLESLLTKPALSHCLYRWAFRSPFRLVLCSRDGSPGESWMNRALSSKVARKRWLNGVDHFDAPSSASKKIRLVLIGRLNPLKQIDKAVDAILNLPETALQNIHVDIIGAGEQYVSIKNKVMASNFASQFKLHGAIPHDAVLESFASADILISLNTHGNLTNTVLEAIRCGLCLVLPEADKLTGIDQDTYSVIPSEAVISLRQDHLLSDLTAALKRLIDEPERIRAFQQKTQELSAKIVSWDERIDREISLFKPYDLAIVISDLRGGGTQRVLERLLKPWVEQGKRIALITLDSVENDVVRLPDSVDRIVLGGVSDSSNKLFGLLANIKRMRQLRKVLKRTNVPVILSFLSTMNVLTVLAARGMDARLVISERNDPSRQSFGRVWDYLRQRYYRRADVVTANSHSALRSLMQFVAQEKCHYVPNPLVLPEKIAPKPLKKPTILAVGRLHHQKAYDVLLNAFALFLKAQPEWELIILGEGPLRSSLESQMNELGIAEAVRLVGFEDPFPYYAAADIYTMPSRFEGMPNALLEAMAMGMPAVISDALQGPLDFVRDQDNAVVVPTENASALAQALLKLAEQPELRQSLSDNAKRSVAAFSMDAVLPQWEVLFDG